MAINPKELQIKPHFKTFLKQFLDTPLYKNKSDLNHISEEKDLNTGLQSSPISVDDQLKLEYQLQVNHPKLLILISQKHKINFETKIRTGLAPIFKTIPGVTGQISIAYYNTFSIADFSNTIKNMKETYFYIFISNYENVMQYTPVTHHNKQCLFIDDIEVLLADVQLKKQLWNAMKVMHNI